MKMSFITWFMMSFIQDRVVKLRELLIHELEGREEGFVKDGRLVTGCEPIVWLTKDGR